MKPHKTPVPRPEVTHYGELVALVGKLYADQKWPLDKLPYTPEFGVLHRGYMGHFKVEVSERDFWRLLTRIRKKGHLPNKTERDTELRQRQRAEQEAEAADPGLGIV